MTDTAEMELVSTGYLARSLGRSQAGVRKLEAQGRIPRGVVILGSGRKVWHLADLPAIEQALRRGGLRKDRVATPTAA